MPDENMSMDEGLKVSAVVATYNRADIIPLTLQHLAKQTLKPSSFEVILVDDGSPDNTEEVVRSLQETLPYRLRYLKHPNRGPGYTINQGIRAALGPIVCLIADDILLAPQALESFLESHRNHPETNAAILGKVVQSPGLRIKSVFLRKWDPFKFRQLERYSELPYYFFWACNVSCKREFLLANGLYREEMGRAGPAAHEDVELGYRLSRRGLRIFYDKRALGYHYHIETLEGAIRRAYQRGLNWKDFRALVNDPVITVRYHILNFHTLKDHFLAFTRPNNLVGADRNPLFLFFRQIARFVLFNSMTLPFLWLPLMKWAEKNSFVGSIMQTQFYRGVISYHFFKGVAYGGRL